MVKEKKRFSDLFSESWKEFKLNWKIFLVILILLSFIPSLVMRAFVYFFQPEILKSLENADISQIMPMLFNFYLPFLIIFLIIFVLGTWMNSSFIFNSVYKKKYMSVNETLKGGRKYFWRLLGLTLFSGLILGVPFFLINIFGIYLNLIETSIIMIIYWLIFVLYILFFIWIIICWIFSAYILIRENKGIIDSLKLSKRLIKGKWWRTFGYLFLFILIIGGIVLIIALIWFLINFIINPNYFNDLMNQTPNLLNEIVSLAFGYIINIFFVPLSIFFLKNLYLARKNEMKK